MLIHQNAEIVDRLRDVASLLGSQGPQVLGAHQRAVAGALSATAQVASLLRGTGIEKA
jgi:hypothetical protein